MRADQAEQRYTAALQAAVAACAADTEGQTCYICFEGGSDEGLVRMCACRGGNGFVHVSCLAEQAKILFAEADARVGDDRTSMRWDFACPACGHGEAFFKKLQIRSAPWPQHRIFYRCCGRGCRHRWKEEPEIDY